MNIDRREAIKRVAGAAVAGMGGTAMAMGVAPAAIDPVDVVRGGPLDKAWMAAEAFAENCILRGCHMKPLIAEFNAAKLSLMEFREADSTGPDDPFRHNGQYVHALVGAPGVDEPMRVDFTQVNMIDGSSKIIARHVHTTDAKFDFFHSASEDGSSIAGFGKRLSGWIVLPAMEMAATA